jgi:protein-S-isoprenylcysteine O-methyltransferase Ste14
VTFHLPETLIHWLLVGSSAATVLFFAGGLTLYFERSPRPAWVLLIHYASVVLSVVQVAVLFVFPTRLEPFVAAAIAMFTAAILLFLSSIEAANRSRLRLQRSFVDYPLPDRLITDGPYRWVRHPFGVGYLLAALATPIAIDHWLPLLIAAPLVAFVIAAAVREEQVWLSSPARSDEYREYRRKTGMFIPFIGRDVR